MFINISALPTILVLSGAAFLCTDQLVSAQSQQQPASLAPTLKVTTRTVIVDVVVNEGGKPVPDLKQGDFTLLEDGNTQKVDFFEPHFADLAKAGAMTPASPADSPVFAPVGAATGSGLTFRAGATMTRHSVAETLSQMIIWPAARCISRRSAAGMETCPRCVIVAFT